MPPIDTIKPCTKIYTQNTTVIVKYSGTIFLSLLSPKICNQYPGISGS